MKNSRRSFVTVLASSIAAATLALASSAHADPRVVSGQFASAVENNRPTGDAAAIAAARNAIYYMLVANDGEPTTVTVVWKLDGREVRRQQLDVGRAPRWRTWAMHRTRGAHSIEVQVLDAAGSQIHTESLTLP